MTVRKRPSARERAEKGDIKEYWVCKYVRENFKKLGFSKISGPFEYGPDFRGTFKGKEVLVEVERSVETYLIHGHPEDPRFKKVSVLIVLSSEKPDKGLKKKLPPTILYIDLDRFVLWFRKAAEEYRNFKEFVALRESVAREFKARFAESCGSTERDMATCPDCDLCPYFGEGTDIPPSLLLEYLLPDRR